MIAVGLCTGTGLGCPWARPTLNISGAAYRWTRSLGGSWLKILFLTSHFRCRACRGWARMCSWGSNTWRANITSWGSEDIPAHWNYSGQIFHFHITQSGGEVIKSELSQHVGIVEISNIKIFYRNNRLNTLIFILFIDHSIVEEFMFINKISVENLRIYSY